MRHKRLQNHAVLAKGSLGKLGKKADKAKESFNGLVQVLEQYYAKLN